MGTAITLTKLQGPIKKPGGGGVEYLFSGALDTTDATGIQTMDVTSYFGYVHNIEVGSNDTLADNGYKLQGKDPGATTAVTSTNCEISVHQSKGSNAAMDPVESTDLSAIGAVKIKITGKAAIVSSWA